MRPRLFAAEIGTVGGAPFAERQASMRPRLFAAEIMAKVRARALGRLSFNEAAAIRRGNLSMGGREIGVRHASMRPRLFAAEIEIDFISTSFRTRLQ